MELRIATGLAFVVAPLIWTRVFYSLFVLPKLMTVSLAALLVGIAALRAREPRGGAGPFVERAVFAFWAVLAVSTALSVDPYLSFVGRYNDYAYGALSLALYTIAFFWGAGMSESQRRDFVLYAVAGGAVVGWVAVTQTLGFRPLLQFDLPGGRAVSTIGSPVHLGALCAALLVLAVPLKGEGSVGRRMLCASLAAAGLFLSYSRGAWLAAGAGLATAFALPRLLRSGSRLVGPATLGAALVAVLVSGFVVGRFRSTGDSDLLRLEAYRASAHILKEHPLFGSGPDTFGVEFRKRKSEEFVRVGGETLRHEHAHNDLLQYATTTGGLGLFALLALIAAWLLEFRERWRSASESVRTRGLRFAGAAAAVFTAAKFNPMSVEVQFLGAAAAGAALSALALRRDGSERSDGLRAGGIAVFGAAACAASMWLCVADAYSQRGRTSAGALSLENHRLAAKTNPCETQLSRRYINALLDLAREHRAEVVRFDYLDAASAAVSRTAGCRPGSFDARYAAGFVALLEAQLGRPDRIHAALREIAAARVLDPTFAPLLQLGATAAKTAQDRELFEEYRDAALRLKR